jgi:GT2 family glycosyltransferase
MSTKAGLSVLLPVYNGDRYLEECLQSLSQQTLHDFEIVVIDDGSIDTTPAILESWVRREPRLQVHRQPHGGLISALNVGLGLCSGGLIARMDADDIAHPERFRLQRMALDADPRIDVLGCRVTHFGDDGVGEGFRIYEKWLNGLMDNDSIRRELFIESPLSHPSVMMRRSVLEAVGSYRDVGWPEDYDLWHRLAASGARFEKLPQTLLQWRDHDQRLTRADGRYAVERFIECKAHFLCSGPVRGCDRLIVWGAGQTGRRLSKHLLRNGATIEAFVDIDPRKCGRTMRRIPIVSPEELTESSRSSGRRPTVLAAVASRGARAKIRTRLTAEGWEETRNFWCVA